MRLPLAILLITGFLIYSSSYISAQSEQPIPANFSVEKVAEGLSLPQGLVWNGSNTLFVSNNSNWIARIRSNKLDTFAVSPTTPIDFKKINGLSIYKDGSLFACDYERGTILKFSEEDGCEIVSPGYEGEKFNKPHGLVFDEKGNLYFTDPKTNDRNVRDGRIFMVPRGSSRSKLVFDGLGYPTGLAISQDGQKLYVCESALQRIVVFQIKKDGTLGSYYEFMELPGGTPIGIAIDMIGNLYVAHRGTGIIYEISPSREILNEIKIRGKNPNYLAFGDEDMKSIFFTEDETNSVYKIRVDTPGLKLFSSP